MGLKSPDWELFRPWTERPRPQAQTRVAGRSWASSTRGPRRHTNTAAPAPPRQRGADAIEGDVVRVTAWAREHPAENPIKMRYNVSERRL